MTDMSVYTPQGLDGVQLQGLAKWAATLASARVTPFDGLARVTGEPVTITELPVMVNLVLYGGDDFAMQVEVFDANGDPADLTGAVAAAQIRATPEAPNVAGEFTPLVQEAAGIVVLDLAGEVSAGLPRVSVYDAEVVAGGRTTTLIAGTITMTAQVTRPS
jgi:hypothetical protein